MTEVEKMLPPGHSLRVLELGELPHYNQDIFDAGLPQSVVAVGTAVKAADAILIASPEYNYSIPGVLKNAIDWLSRLPTKPLQDKPIAIVSASMGVFGGVRMQLQLRQALMFTGGRVLVRPEFFLGSAASKFDASLTLVDEETKKHLHRFLDSFLEFAS